MGQVTRFRIEFLSEDGGWAGHVWHTGDDDTAEATARREATVGDMSAKVIRQDGSGWTMDVSHEWERV